MATLPGLDHASTMEETKKTIENKLKVLKLMHGSTETIAGSKLIKPIQRQRKLLESKVEECHELKTEVQELKLERGDDEEDIKSWSVEIEKRLMEYEKVVRGLKGTQCPWIAIGVGALGGMTEGVIRHFKPNKEIGNPSPVFIVNQGNTNQLIVTKSKR